MSGRVDGGRSAVRPGDIYLRWPGERQHIDFDFDAQLQLSRLRWVTSSAAGAAGLAENYAGLDIATAHPGENR